MRNQNEINIHGVGSAALLVVGLLMLAVVYVQGHIYTREGQLTRERSDYQQQQIAELRSRLEMAEARVIRLEDRAK